MELHHQFVVPATPERTWEAFNDLDGIAPCFPGATLGVVDGNSFDGSVKIKLGPIALLYNGAGKFIERDQAAGRVVIEAKGKDKRGNGTATAKVTATLAPDGDGTAVEVVTDLTITGKPAQFGRGVIQDVSDKLLGQFVDCIASQLRPAEAAHAEAEHAAPAASPAGARSYGPADEEAADLDLMRTVGPVLVRRYAKYAVSAVVAFVVLRTLRRRRSRSVRLRKGE